MHHSSAAEFAVFSGDDVSAARKKLLALGSQVDAKMEITRVATAVPRIEPGSVLDPASYKKPEPAPLGTYLHRHPTFSR
jgi:hypothetical protein